MKYTLLATTALVALSAPAFAGIEFSGSARIGMVTTEGAAAVVVDSTFNMLTDDALFVEAMDDVANYEVGRYADQDSTGATIDATITIDITPDAEEMTQVETLRESILDASKLGATSAIRATAKIDLASIDAVIARTNATTNAAVAKASDTTVGMNRVRISFSGSGETDSGMAYGFSARADQSNTSNGGTQYISGAFGKISMGDLNGGDEQLVGNLDGVGSSGAGDHQEFGYQSSAHNIGYSISLNGVSFAATTDLVRGADSALTGSNSAMGISWNGDMGGAKVGVAVGQSKIGTASEKSASVSIGIGGLSIKAVSHTNDNGPITAAVTASASAAAGTTHVAAVAEAANNDTDTTGLSISYTMDAMSVTAYTRTESTTGVVDQDFSGVGFTYDLGGATVKAGFVDNNDISIMDFGINFSF